MKPSCLAVCAIVLGVSLIGDAVFIQAKAVVAQLLLERAWQATIVSGADTRAWSWADTHPVARIEFPRLGRSAIVLEEGGGEALAFGPAHVAASPLPGESGTSVIGGHRDTHFSFIREMRPGDKIRVTGKSGHKMTFRMTGSAIVEAQSSGISTGGVLPRLALVTCYPFDGPGHSHLRYVVFAEAETR